MRSRLSPVLALTRELFTEQRLNVILVAGFVLAAIAMQILSSGAWDVGATLLALNAFLLTFMIFSRTESNLRRNRRGFPARYFPLPVSTLTLVAVPLVLGVVSVEAVLALLLASGVLPQSANALWIYAKTGTFMLTYQMLLWCAARLGAMRIVVIGLLCFVFMVLPSSPLTNVLLGLWAIAAFALSWFGVARQRAGGSSHQSLFDMLFDRLASLQLTRSERFASIHAAQLWYEWRKIGYLLPAVVCSLLVAGILPLTFVLGPGLQFVLLIFTLLTPVLLAAPIGKAFSKADTWSMDSGVDTFTESTRPLSVPSFLAVKPLSANAIVIAKLEAAALSTALSWAAVLSFTLVWQFGWADTTALRGFGNILWAMQGHRLWPQFAIAVLLVVFLVLLTWRFLVSGLWIGLSGNGKLFTATTVPLVLVPTAGVLLLDEFFGWLMDDPARFTVFVWGVGALVALKFWLAAFTWRGISRELTHRYLSVWAAGTCCTLGLAILATEPLSLFFAIDLPVMRSLLLFVALLTVPLAQIGLAPGQLAANRHR